MPPIPFKLIAFLVIAGAFALLGFTANHYHNKWVEAQQEIAVKETELATAKAAVQECSDRTRQMVEDTNKKVEQVAKAQEAAATAARGNYQASNKILQAIQANPDQCIAAAQLLDDYKRGLYGAKK